MNEAKVFNESVDNVLTLEEQEQLQVLLNEMYKTGYEDRRQDEKKELNEAYTRAIKQELSPDTKDHA